MAEDGFRYNKKLSDLRYSPQQPFSAIKYQPELYTTIWNVMIHKPQTS
jgi:hypothetical protein